MTGLNGGLIELIDMIFFCRSGITQVNLYTGSTVEMIQDGFADDVNGIDANKFIGKVSHTEADASYPSCSGFILSDDE